MATHPDPIPIDGITIVREFDAPVELVYDAWTTPRRFAVWFGGENGEIPVESVELDATPGGVWKATMFAGPEDAVRVLGTSGAILLDVEAAAFREASAAPPQFKDLAGVSRKYAIPLLEYLDRERITRRDGDQRVVV